MKMVRGRGRGEGGRRRGGGMASKVSRTLGITSIEPISVKSV